MKHADKKLEIRTASTMIFKVAASVIVKDSSWSRPYASEWSGITKRMLNSSDTKGVNEEAVTESLRIRTTENKERIHQDHIAD